jgi:formylglycine-generating enzyme required for sulfatase activity
MKKTVLFFILLITIVGPVLWAQQKYALVIGNGAYTGISSLRNPVNDANDMEAALRDLGFTVDKVLNGNLDQIETAVMNFQRRLSASQNSYGFFFYAGHGVQSGGDNYLIPVNANSIQNENSLRQRAVSVQWILDNLSDAGNILNMIVLDACRDNPFGWARSGSRGLSVVSGAPAGSIVMYATSANSVAEDGIGRNGLFTEQLLNNIRNQELSIRDVFDKTGEDVLRASNGRQHPELSLRFFGAASAYLGTGLVNPSPAPTSTPTPTPATVTPAATPVRPVPHGFALINGGTFTMGSLADELGRDDDETPHQVTVSTFLLRRYEVTQVEYQEVMGRNPSSFKGDNNPVDSVNWYDAVEFCNRLSQSEGLTPAYTIDGVNVRWNRDANGYRLPTEAEWEYACRAGTTTPFSTGNNITTNQANYSGNYPYNNNARGENRQQTTPVGIFAPNPWGLHDMHGNVAELCWDWYGDYLSAAQTDPAGASFGTYRVIRGGSWYNSAEGARSALRNIIPPAYRYAFVGFRLARNAQ